MKTALKICMLSAILAGCSQNSGNLPVRTTPQAQHPSHWTQGGAAPVQTAPSAVAMAPVQSADTCGAAQYQSLVGGLSRDTLGLDIPDSSRHYGSEEVVATDTPTRLNFVHSGTAFESVTDPTATVIRVFCG